MIDIDSILQTQTYHIFYKNKHLKQLSASTPLKVKTLIKENVNPPKTNKKVFTIRIKSNPTDSKSRLMITCIQQTITPNLSLTIEKSDHMITVKYSEEELEKYGFKLAHIKKIIDALKNHKVSLEKNFINITEILS